MLSSSTTQTYSSMLTSLDDSIRMLEKKRADCLVLFRQSRVSDVLESDDAWRAQAKKSSTDWKTLLNTKTPAKEWRQEVPLHGVTGTTEWAAVQERAITLELYSEMPERIDVLVYLLEQVFPAMAPWPDGRRAVSIRAPGRNILLCQGQDGGFFLAVNSHGQAEPFVGLKAALKEAQKRVAQSFFNESM